METRLYIAVRNLPVEVVERVFVRAEAQIAVPIEPERQRIPVGDDKPLTYVELRVVNQQRPFCNSESPNIICSKRLQTRFKGFFSIFQ